MESVNQNHAEFRFVSRNRHYETLQHFTDDTISKKAPAAMLENVSEQLCGEKALFREEANAVEPL